MAKRMSRLMAGATVAAVVAGMVNYSQQRTEAAFSTPVNVAVTANVASNCVMTAGSVAFGAYDPLVTNAAANLDQTGSVSVACVKGTVANVGLGSGTNYSSGRRMSNGTDFLAYDLYTTAGRTTVWDTTNRVSYTAGSKASTSLTIYGRVPSNQDVSAGSYTDTVVAQAEF